MCEMKKKDEDNQSKLVWSYLDLQIQPKADQPSEETARCRVLGIQDKI